MAKLKRFIFPIGMVILAIVILFVFFRVLRGRGASAKNVTLTYWFLWEDDKVLAPQIEVYKKIHPNVTIKIVKQTGKEYRERLENVILKGEGPDLFRFHNTWLPMFYQKGVIAPIPEKIMKPSEFQSAFYPVVSRDLKVGNAYYGIPLTFDALGLFYNKAMLKAVGASPPTSWDQLPDLAKSLTVPTSDGRIRTAGIALGTTSNIEFWPDILGFLLLLNGGSITSPNGPKSEDAVLLYTEFARTYKVWDDTLDNSVLAFAGEKVAMIFAPSWAAHEIKVRNPSLDFAIAPIPQLPGVNMAWATYWVEGVSSKSKNQAEAFEFLKFLSEKDTMTRLYTEEAKIDQANRLFGEPYSRVDLASSVKGDPYLDAIVSMGPYAHSGYMSSRTYDNGLNDRIIKYYEDAVNSVLKGSSPQSALDTANKGISQVLTDFGISTANSSGGK